MEPIEEKISKLYETVRCLQAENMALKNLIYAMYAQKGDINNVMKHFIEVCFQYETHNTFSTLPEDFVKNFSEAHKELVQGMQVALQRAPELRNKK